MRLFLILLFIVGRIYGLSAQALDEMILKCQYRLLYVKDTLNPKNVESDVMILESCRLKGYKLKDWSVTGCVFNMENYGFCDG